MAKPLRSCAGLAIGPSRCPHLVAAGVIAPLAVLWVAPTLGLNSGWGAWGVEASLVAAAMGLAAMLAIAADLAATDWLIENESRKAWAATAAGVADLSAMPAAQVPEQSKGSYPPAANDETLWAILRAHRHAAYPSSLSADGKRDPAISLRGNALQPTATDDVPSLSDDMAPGMAREAIATGKVGALDRAKMNASQAAHGRAPIIRATERKGRWHLAVLAATRMRLVANARPRDAWSDFGQRSVPQRLPIKIVSNIIILGQGNQRATGGERPPGAEPSDGFRTGSNGGQHPRARIESLQPEIAIEAKRQLIALAEALARQAAREDEAAERLAERSRSPPDVSVENPPGHDDKENAS